MHITWWVLLNDIPQIGHMDWDVFWDTHHLYATLSIEKKIGFIIHVKPARCHMTSFFFQI
jgi:hypothetical protein